MSGWDTKSTWLKSVADVVGTFINTNDTSIPSQHAP